MTRPSLTLCLAVAVVAGCSDKPANERTDEGPTTSLGASGDPYETLGESIDPPVDPTGGSDTTGEGSETTESSATQGPVECSETSDAEDRDGDGICDRDDNCVDVPNPEQAVSMGNATGDACTWPNQISRANSDPWIAEHHAALRHLAPRVLVINFANGLGVAGGDNVDGGPLPTSAIEAKATAFIDAMREASRPHGYEDPEAPPQLEPRLVGVVDLQDNNGHANASSFPRGALSGDGYPRVGYDVLFTDAFAEQLGYKDPETGRFLRLGELVERGEVHDVILVANQVDPVAGNPVDQVTRNILEVAFVAQAYDADRNLIPDAYVKNGAAFDQQGVDVAGASVDNSMRWSQVGRSLRIYFLNASRGVGCLQHSLGHDMEFRYNEAQIYAPGAPYHGRSPHPYLQSQFRSFADFDMQARYGVPFDSLYAGGNEYAYDDCTEGVCATLRTPAGVTAEDYAPRCGNTHYPPGAIEGYDYNPIAAVLSSCESFASGEETATPSDPARWNTIEVDNDCGGRFLTYWFQNMPGATTPFGQTEPSRLSWWPFFYY